MAYIYTFSYWPLHMDVPVLVDQQEVTYKYCVDTDCSLEDVPRAMDDRDNWGERERVSAKSVLAAWLDEIYISDKVYMKLLMNSGYKEAKITFLKAKTNNKLGLKIVVKISWWP